VLHVFAGTPSDGESCFSGLIRDAAGNLYGATEGGGSTGVGTLFQIVSADVMTLLHSFNRLDGGLPMGSLVRDSQGNLYGTTFSYGPFGQGTVFKRGTAGDLTTLHGFPGPPDGAWPPAGLLLLDGNLYGTTSAGGTADWGTVFAVNLKTGNETVLYSFTSGADGAAPDAALIGDGAGNLYSTTLMGGSGMGFDGNGVLFRLNLASRKVTTLHTFSGADGNNPHGGLTRDPQGNLYGTTDYGGPSGSPPYGLYGYGTVFELDTAGTLTTLHFFSGGTDGGEPYAGLVQDSKGRLYGAASGGGLYGYGTIFEIIP
jgi:uncharacterized repeat protein (TIGR03803 family)